MDEIKPISENRIRFLAKDKKFDLIYFEKDYYLTVLLYFLKDTPNIYFKGGTALNKIFLNHRRLSEDLDFTCSGSIEETKKRIVEIAQSKPDFFTKTEFDKQTPGFFRVKITYKSFTDIRPEIIVDVNKQATIHLKPEKHKVSHFYDEIPEFSVNTLNKKELVAEKIRTLFQRKKPRDFYDTYSIIQEKMPIDMPLVRKKLKDVNKKFELKKIFKNANKVYSHWEEISKLTNHPIDYKTAIKEIAKRFKYKEAKKKRKKLRHHKKK